MKFFKILFLSSFSLSVPMLFVPACGGSSVAPGGDGGGVDGAGGNHDSGHGGRDGAARPDSSSGGDGSSGGDSAMAGGDSSTMGGDSGTMCPVSPPMMGAMCTFGEPPCSYAADGGNLVCECGGGPAGPGWNCTTCPACPMTQPTGACTPGPFQCAAEVCTYGTSTSCTCAGFGTVMDTWVCGTCPKSAPMAGSACSTVELACDYGATRCRCRPDMMGGMGDVWQCEAPPPACPHTQPSPGTSCTLGTGAGMGCTYGSTVCRCEPGAMMGSDVWSCT